MYGGPCRLCPLRLAAFASSFPLRRRVSVSPTLRPSSLPAERPRGEESAVRSPVPLSTDAWAASSWTRRTWLLYLTVVVSNVHADEPTETGANAPFHHPVLGSQPEASGSRPLGDSRLWPAGGSRWGGAPHGQTNESL